MWEQQPSTPTAAATLKAETERFAGFPPNWAVSHHCLRNNMMSRIGCFWAVLFYKVTAYCNDCLHISNIFDPLTFGGDNKKKENKASLNTSTYFAGENKNQPSLVGTQRQVQCLLLLSFILDIVHHVQLTYFTLTALFYDHCSPPSSFSYAMSSPFHW